MHREIQSECIWIMFSCFCFVGLAQFGVQDDIWMNRKWLSHPDVGGWCNHEDSGRKVWCVSSVVHRLQTRYRDIGLYHRRPSQGRKRMATPRPRPLHVIKVSEKPPGYSKTALIWLFQSQKHPFIWPNVESQSAWTWSAQQKYSSISHTHPSSPRRRIGVCQGAPLPRTMHGSFIIGGLFCSLTRAGSTFLDVIGVWGCGDTTESDMKTATWWYMTLMGVAPLWSGAASPWMAAWSLTPLAEAPWMLRGTGMRFLHWL